MEIKNFHHRQSFKRRVRDFLVRCRIIRSRWDNKLGLPQKPKQNKWIQKILKITFGFFLLLLIYAVFFLPSVKDATQFSFAQSTIIYDRKALDPTADPNNHILYIIHGDENREYIPFKDIPKSVANATIAIEDDQFYHHFGFDIGATFKAALHYFFHIGAPRGGSTITQQLVKNTFLSRERTIWRKFNELLLAIKVEIRYPKNKILDLYLNNIPYGNNANGIEAAAKTFFGKSARDLTLAEAAVIASIPAAPTKFSPYGPNKDLLMGYYSYEGEDKEKVYHKGRKDLILERMLDLKMITQSEFAQALEDSKKIVFRQDKTDIKAPHFVFYVRQKLEDKYGTEFLKDGGLHVYTTLHPDLQKIAEDTIAQKSAGFLQRYGARNVALAAINPADGEILAYVGGKDFFDTENDGQVDVLNSRRQPGSSFKPYVYAAAFGKGYSPGTLLWDVPTDFGGNYQPQNFDGTFQGPVSAREALDRSLNIPAIKMAFLATPESVIATAHQAGVQFDGNASDHGVAIGIGVADVDPLSHINGYQIFVNAGPYHDPTAILEVTNDKGEVLEKFDPEKTKHDGIDPEVAELVRNILTDEKSRPTVDGFDWNSLLQLDGYDNGVKTGTSNRKIKNPDFKADQPESDANFKFINVPSDAWTIGFTPSLIAGVWVGNNRGEPLNLSGNGMSAAAPIWKKFMLDSLPILTKEGNDGKRPYLDPKPLETKNINIFSGKIASDKTPASLVRQEVFASFSVPTELDNSVKQMVVQQRLSPFDSLGRSTTKLVLTSLHSERPDLPNWENPVQQWLRDHPDFLAASGISTVDTETVAQTQLQNSTFAQNNNGDFLVRAQQWEQQKKVFSLPAFGRNAPRILILSPKQDAEVSTGNIEIPVTLDSKTKIKGVQYYFDGKLVTDSIAPPWTGQLQIPSTTPMGTKHSIKALVTDEFYNTGEAMVTIKIAPDKEGPHIIFLGPLADQKIPLGTQMTALVDAHDQESLTKSVEFSLDGQVLATVSTEPFETVFVALGDQSIHHLKVRAWDINNNVSEKEIPIEYTREKLVTAQNPEMENVIAYRNSISVDLVFPNPQNIEWAELSAQKDGTVFFSQKITELTKTAEIQILKKSIGPSELHLRVKMKNNTDIFEAPVKTIDL